MNKNPSRIGLAALAALDALCLAPPAAAQVAGGTTTVEPGVTASTTPAMGWSVKKTLLGKSLYKDAGQKVGKGEALNISPERNLSFVIVGADVNAATARLRKSIETAAA